MASTVTSLSPAHAIVEVVHTGAVTASDLRGVAKQVQEIAQETGIHLLLGNYLEATDLPGAIESISLVETLRPEAGASFRHALLWPKDDQARIELDVARMAESNQGIHIKVFGNRDAAIDWLES